MQKYIRQQAIEQDMITTKQMKDLEEQSEQKGVTKLDLMENAGNAIVKFLGTNLLNKRVAIFCGSGNNGGDGFVAARLLSKVCDVTVLFLGNEENMAIEAKENFSRVLGDKRIKVIRYINDLEDSYDVLIDAMLGTGGTGELKEPIKSAVLKFNLMKAYKVCVDVPTGMDPDTGEVTDFNCQCDKIITFHDAKAGLENVMDKVIIADIGIVE
jgi:NAD(P)H-hydrate epimerase